MACAIVESTLLLSRAYFDLPAGHLCPTGQRPCASPLRHCSRMGFSFTVPETCPDLLSKEQLHKPLSHLLFFAEVLSCTWGLLVFFFLVGFFSSHLSPRDFDVPRHFSQDTTLITEHLLDNSGCVFPRHFLSFCGKRS